jgi:hypothetical protein
MGSCGVKVEGMSSGKSPTKPRQAVITRRDVNGFLYIERGVLNRWDLHASQCLSLRYMKLPLSYDCKFYLRAQWKVEVLITCSSDRFWQLGFP